MTTDTLEKEEQEIIVTDEKGKVLSEDEAIQEENKLEAMMERYFVNNPSHTIPSEVSEVEYDDEEDEEEETPVLEQKYSFVDDYILEAVIRNMLEELNEEYDEIVKSLHKVTINSTSGVDNLIDEYRKERNHLSSVIYGGEILLDKAPEYIQNKVKKKARKLLQEGIEFLTDDKPSEALKEIDAQNEIISGLSSCLTVLMEDVESLRKEVSRLGGNLHV